MPRPHHLVALAATACAFAVPALAQDARPGETVTINVPAAPGGTTGIVTRLRDRGAEAGGPTPEEFTRCIDAERQRWTHTVEAARLTMDA